MSNVPVKQGQSSSSAFHFFAGLSSGIFSAVLLQPADLLKTRVQQAKSTSLLSTLRTISNGPSPFRALWRGTLPSALRTGIGSALYFSSLNALRQGVAKSELLAGSALAEGTSRTGRSSSSLPRLSNAANLLTGAFARASVGLVMMPITVIKVRYESNLYAYKSLVGAGKDIFLHEGIRGFFSGFGATAVRDAPYAGLYVVFYEQCKQRLSRYTGRESAKGLGVGMKGSTSAGINFLSGIISAGLATAITNPFDAIKTRIQLMPQKYGNMFTAAKMMIRDDGAKVLLDGLGIRMARKAISSALAWTLYEELIRRAERKLEDR